jgi:transglutaminase/protease-like cytokinesis protein 3
VTNNIEYDVKSIHRSKLRTDKPNAVLRRGKTICGGYADLITAMNQEVGIPAQTIIGYYKDWKFDEGDKFFIPNHAWNAIQLNNKWHYIDATAGAGFTSLQPN